MKWISLTKGLKTCVDDEDYEYLNKYKWHVIHDHNTFYARRVQMINGKRKIIKLHRLIMGVDNPKIIIDHIDRNGLNNLRSNLKFTTKSENSRNRIEKKHSSKFIGVYYNGGRWIAKISIMGNTIYLGKFISEHQAHEAYIKAKNNPQECLLNTLNKMIAKFNNNQ